MRTTRLRHDEFVGQPARLLAFLIALALMPGALYAQGSGGGIQGRVTDSSEAVIPGAAVQVKGRSGFSRTVTTDAEGKFAVGPDLRPLEANHSTFPLVARGSSM